MLMLTQAKLIAGAARWQGSLDATLLSSPEVAAGNRLADAAKLGDWAEVFMTLEDDQQWVVPYQWRPGGKGWFTILHQAAWHGAPTQVTEKLIKRGALRLLQDAKGRLPIEVAMERNHPHLGKLLKPRQPSVDPYRLQQLDLPLADLIFWRCEEISSLTDPALGGDTSYWQRTLRHPPVAILAELRKQQVWFPMRGSEGAFRISLHQGFLEVISWHSIAKGLAQAHVVTVEGIHLVDAQFA